MERALPRRESLRAFRQWLASCPQPLAIVAPAYSGKTFFLRQLRRESECAALHECRREAPHSSEAATVVRSLSAQLSGRFPNLVLPSLHAVTLLTDPAAVEDGLLLPLKCLPQPARPLFLAIDNVDASLQGLVLQVARGLPPWLKLVVSSRGELSLPLFHSFSLLQQELRLFAEQRLAAHCVDEGSWFFVEQIARAFDFGLLSSSHIPLGTEELLEELSAVLPSRLPLLLQLIRSSRKPPSQTDLLAACQLIASQPLKNAQKDLVDLDVILESCDPVVLLGAWNEVEDDLAPFHASWAELRRLKKCRLAEDVVHLAFHLAHSNVPLGESLRLLKESGVGDLELRCPVLDLPTTQLLLKAGARLFEDVENEDFVQLCVRGDAERVRILLPRVTPSEAGRGLVAAASRGRRLVVETVLEGRPSAASFVNEEQWNALRAAACNNELAVLDLLISRGLAVDDCGSGGRTALRAAAWSGHVDVVRRLLAAHADVERKDCEGRSPLMAAAFMDHHLIVELLLLHGADLHCVDRSGATALHLVLSNGAKSKAHDETLHSLLKSRLLALGADSCTDGADANVADANGRLPLHLAAYHGDENLESLVHFSFSIDAPDSTGRTPLMLAACQGQLASCQTLIARGADVDSIDSEGRTALVLAALHAHLPVVDLLLSLGADEGHKDNDGAVALHYACVHEDVAVVRALATSTTLHCTDRHGNHPLLVAVQHPHPEVVRELLECGAPVHLQALDGRSPLSAAALAGHAQIVELLAPHITDWTQLDLEGTPLLHTLLISGHLSMAEQLLRLGAFSSARDAHGRTASHVVAQMNDVRAAALLRSLAANFESGDSAGRTPLMTAVWAGHVPTSLFLLENQAVNPNAVDHQGASALHVASQLGSRDLVVLLLRFGAETSLRDTLGRTALDVAVQSGHDHIVVVLKAASGSADSSGFGSLPNSPLHEGLKGAPLRPKLPNGAVVVAATRSLKREVP